MALRLVLGINDEFYIENIKVSLSSCKNIWRKTVTASFNVFYPEGIKVISLTSDSKFEVIDSAFIEIWPTGSVKRNLLSIAVSAPKEIYIRGGLYDKYT